MRAGARRSREPRDIAATADLRQQITGRGDRIGRHAAGAISLGWYRGEQSGQEDCIRWLQRHSHKRAATALKAHLFPKDGLRVMT
jgi:hypothetical protein